MKIPALVLCIFCLFCSGAAAQEPAATPNPKSIAISGNYVMTLITTDKEEVVSELSLVIASPRFTANFPDSKLNVTSFQGTITPEDDDTILVEYALGGSIAVTTQNGQNVQYRSVSTQSSVRLKLGEPVQFLKNDTRVCTLRIARLPDQPAKGK